MDTTFNDSLTQLDELLAAGNQSWLFGAGISLDAGIPLMLPLTKRVFEMAEEYGEEDDKKVLDHVKGQLSDYAHIEHILSQLSDYRTIAERSKEQNTNFGDVILELEQLDKLHQRILGWIAETIRWGYQPEKDETPQKIGSRDNSIVKVNLILPSLDRHPVKRVIFVTEVIYEKTKSTEQTIT